MIDGFYIPYLLQIYFFVQNFKNFGSTASLGDLDHTFCYEKSIFYVQAWLSRLVKPFIKNVCKFRYIVDFYDLYLSLSLQHFLLNKEKVLIYINQYPNAVVV